MTIPESPFSVGNFQIMPSIMTCFHHRRLTLSALVEVFTAGCQIFLVRAVGAQVRTVVSVIDSTSLISVIGSTPNQSPSVLLLESSVGLIF